MNFSEIKKLVIAEYDSRNLVSSARYNALEHFDRFLKEKVPDLWNNVSKFFDDRQLMKLCYKKHKGKALNDAESSMINEVYKQITNQGIKLTDYSEVLKGKIPNKP